MTTTYVFLHPEKTIFGQGVAHQVGQCVQELEMKKVFVVTDETILKLDAFKDVEKSLIEKKLDYYIYSEVDLNPTDIQVEKGAKIFQEEKADGILAVGGGSSIDSAKAIGLLVNNGGSIRDYDGGDGIKNPMVPLIAIPTTAGTGSEVTAWSMITDTENCRKMLIGGYKLIPKIALVDPLMMVSMPPTVTAATGLDALSHAIDAYCSVGAMPQTDAVALSAIKFIVKNLGPAIANDNNVEAREGMAMGSLLGGVAINSAGCAGTHALGQQITAQYDIPHGITMGIMMPYIMKFNMNACLDRHADITVAMGENIQGLNKKEIAEKAPFAVYEFVKSAGLPTTLSEVKVDQNLIPACVKWAAKDADLANNPRTATLEQIEEIYKKAFEGNLD